MKENPILVSCREATLLVEKKLHGELSFAEKVQLVLHTAICQACRTYQYQSTKIDRLLKQRFTQEQKTESVDTQPLQQRILRRLNETDVS